MMGATAFNNPAYTVDIIGGHNYYSYIPHFALTYEMHMSFVQRMYNVYLHAFDY